MVDLVRDIPDHSRHRQHQHLAGPNRSSPFSKHQGPVPESKRVPVLILELYYTEPEPELRRRTTTLAAGGGGAHEVGVHVLTRLMDE
jgi:hypothetical protein